MKNEKFEKITKEIVELEDLEISELFVIIHNEMCKREAKKVILRLIDEQK